MRFRQLTATGDAVDVAHRLLEAAKSTGGRVAVSEEVVAAAQAEAEAGAAGLTAGLVAQGACRLPGRAAPLGIWLLPADAAPGGTAAAA